MNTVSKRLAACVAAALLALGASAQSQLQQTLSSLSGVSSVQKLESSVFNEKYLLRVTRPVNPEAAGEMDPSMQTYVKFADPEARRKDAGTFEQRVIVCHAGYDRPTLVVTEGYWADYAIRPNYQEELSRLFDTNIVVVEYRYFGESVPEPCDWRYLTVANSLCDLHHTVEMLKTVYGGKWISTGISKGGQTTMFYRSYYPDDVDISVPYVAPLNKSVEDGRHEPFLSREVGTPAERKIISDYMMRLVRDRDVFLPMFRSFVEEKNYTFTVPVEEVFDLCVAEIRYAIWQWGTPLSSIPGPDATDEEAFRYFIGINDPDYFSEQSPYYAFDVMAAKELGYYGYDIKPFRPYMSVRNTGDYLRRVMLRGDESQLKFDKTLYRHVVRYLRKNDPKMIYIYGGIDPWSASGVCTWLDTSKKENLKVYVREGGSHGTRISSFGEAESKAITDQIRKWLDE